MTIQDILYDVRALIDEYNDDGVLISPVDTANIDTNAIRYINMAIQEIYNKSKTFKTHKISRKPVPNLLGNFSNFEFKEFIGTDITFEADGVKAYYFEVDSDATVYVEELDGTWNTLETLNIAVSELTAYKGLVTSSKRVRLRFSGSTYYKIQNVALFSYPFKATAIPDYRPWVKYELPSDFGELDKIVTEYEPRQYAIDSFYKWEGFNTFYVNYYFDGELRVIYKPVPVRITETTDVLPVNNPTAIQFITFYTAAHVAIIENPNAANTFLQKANELKFESMRGQPTSETKITDVYFGG